MLRAVLATAVLTTGMMLGAGSSAQAQNLRACAPEGGFCRVPYPTRVIYGIQGRGTTVFVNGGGIPCNNRAFGDPAPGARKACVYVAQRGDGRGRFEDDRRGPPRGRWDDDRRGPPRGGFDRGFRDDDRDYDRPVRRYNY
jgi:hypothetical protein